MIHTLNKSKNTPGHKILSIVILVSFLLNSVITPQMVYGMTPASVLNLPIPGSMVALTSGFNPAMIQGITVHPQNPLQFDFIIHPGEQDLEGAAFEEESKRLIKYFLAALTIPEEQLWVNLSPYEENRIITQEFGNTEMGRDLLAQDYMLKQLSASLMYPEEDLGREFWARVHQEAQSRYGTTEIPMNTFNKIWIVPEKAVVHQNGSSVFVVESKLKVLLEEDYAALEHNALNNADTASPDDVVSGVSSEIVREILIPAIEREVNEGATFANLRQIYHSLILAAWYKKNLKESFLGKVYVDQEKTKGIETDDKQINQKIYDQYIAAFKKGVYNYIREDLDPVTQSTIPRKYFSGGVDYAQLSEDIEETGTDPLSAQFLGARNVRVNLDAVDQYGATVDTASIIKSAGAAKALAVPNDQAMLSVLTDKIKDGLGIKSALTRQSLTASVIRYHKGHSAEETNDFTRALAALAIQAARVAPIVDDSGTPAQEIKAAGIAVSAPLDVTLVWETQDYGLLKLTDVYAETGGGPVNSAKTFANQDVPFGITAISYPDPLRKTWESSLSDQRLKKYFAEAAAGGTKVNVLNIVDGQPLRMLVGRGEAISDEIISRLLLQLDRMLTAAPDLKWLMLTAGGGIAYDRTHYLYGTMVEKAHDFGVDAFIDFKYSSSEREIRSVLEVERKQPQDILAPNIREFILILEKLRMVEPGAFNRRTMPLEQIESYARALMAQYNLKGILITRDKEGIIFVPREGQMLVEPAIPVAIKSNTSAGDAASAGFVLALIQGKSYAQAIKEANIFGAATVILPGSQVATKETVRQVKDSAMLASKLFTPEEVAMIRGVWERLTPGPQADAKSLEEEIQELLERSAAPNEKYYVTIGSWMNFIDVVQEVLDRYDPGRNRMHDDLSNLFDLSLTKLLTNLNGFAHHNGAMIIKVSDFGDQNYQFDTVLLDRSTQFVDPTTQEHVPIDQVLAYWTKDGRGRIRGESLPMAVLAVDRFSILTAQPTTGGNSTAYYWDAQFDLKKDADGPEVILDDAPVREGTMIVISSRLSMDERYDWLQRDLYRPRDAALLAVTFDEGVHAISRWIAEKLKTKRVDEPLVIAINGAAGSGKTTLKKIIVAALKQRGFEKDKDNVYNHYDSHRYIHYYEELWESMSGAESFDELWGNKFYGHNGIVIVESVVKEVPPEWRSRDNLLLVQLVAGEQNRRDRLANRGSSPELAREKAAYDGQKLDDFTSAVSIINDDAIINMLFLGIQKFLYSFDQAALSEETPGTLVRAARDFYRLYDQAAFDPSSLGRMYQIARTIAQTMGIDDIEGQRRKRLAESGGYEKGYILFREREPGGGVIVEEHKEGRLLRDGTLQPRIDQDTVSDQLGDWIIASEPQRVAALKNKLKEEFDDIVRELEHVLAGQTDRQKRLIVVLTNFMEAVRSLQDIDQAKPRQEVTWEDLVRMGYSVNIYPASIPFSPESYTAVVSRNGVALHESKVVYQVYPGLKLIHLTMYYPRFPEKDEKGFIPGSGRALLRYLLNPNQYAGYHIISSASVEARKSFLRMGDFHIDRDNPEVGRIDEIAPGPNGITPLTNIGRVKDAFNKFSESVISSPAFTRLNKTQQQHLLKILRLTNVHLMVPDSAMTAELSNDPFEQQLLSTHGVTHLDRHAFNQALLMSGVNAQVIAKIDEKVWEDLKRDIESGLPVNELLKKGYRARLGIGSGKRMTTALQLLTKKPKKLALPVIPIFVQHWGKASAQKAAAAMMEEYARLVEERSGRMPKVIWVQEDVGADLKALGHFVSAKQMTRINETFQRIFEHMKDRQQAPHLTESILSDPNLIDSQTAQGLSELLAIFVSFKESSASASLENIIEELQDQSRINEQNGRIDYDLEFNLALLKSLEIYPLEFHREIEGMNFMTFLNLLWSDYIQLMETVAYVGGRMDDSRKLRRWGVELHARSNMIERDLNDFVPFLYQLAEETAKTESNAVIVFVRGLEHERINQILKPQVGRLLYTANTDVDLARRWKDATSRITDDAIDIEFITHVIENVATSIGFTREELVGRGLIGTGLDAAMGQALRGHIQGVYRNDGYPNGLMISFLWLLNQRDQKGELLLPPVWDDFIREHLLNLRLSQYREVSKRFYQYLKEAFHSEAVRMAIVQYFISLYTSGMEDQQRQRFIRLALGDAFGQKEESELKAAFPSLFDNELVPQIGDFSTWMDHFTRSGYSRQGLPITPQDIAGMAQWFEDITARQPFLLPVAPRPDTAMLADVPETLTVNHQHLKLVPLTPDLLKKYKFNIAQLISFMTKGSPAWMVERDLEVQVENKIQYDPEMSFVVLGENGLPVGMTIAYQPQNKKHVYLSSFSVHPDFQGTSVSSWLLYKTFRAAVDKNLKTAVWETYPRANHDDYARANGYYRRIGAAPVSAERDGIALRMVYRQDLADLLPKIYRHFREKKMDYAMLGQTVFHQTNSADAIRDIVLRTEPERPIIKISGESFYQVNRTQERGSDSLLSDEDFLRLHQIHPYPVVIAATQPDIDHYLKKRIPAEAKIRITPEGIYVDGIRQETTQPVSHDLIHIAYALAQGEKGEIEDQSHVLDVIVFQTLVGVPISPVDRMMDHAYEELAVGKVENYFNSLIEGRTEAVEKLDRELDRLLSEAGWTQEDFDRMVRTVERLKVELKEKGFVEVQHKVGHQLTSADLPINQYDRGSDTLQDTAMLADLPNELQFQNQAYKIVHITPALLSKHQNEFAALLQVMNPQKTLAQMQDRIAHLFHKSDEYSSLYSLAVLGPDGKPVGMTMANDSSRGDYVYLSTFVIDPKLQGAPLAAWLLYHTFYNAHTNGMATVKWETFPREDSDIYRRANAFYKKIGAVPVKDTPFDGFRRVEYVYNLSKGLPKILDEYEHKLSDKAMLSAVTRRTDSQGRSATQKTWDIILEVVSAMRHSSQENIAAVMNKYRGMSAFYKELGQNGVYFLEEPVNDPAEFGGRFKKGDKILKFHIDGTDRTKMRILLKEVLSAEVAVQLREAGYAGIYFNTTNQSLRWQWLRDTKSVVMNAPRGTAVKTYLTALYGRVFYGYSITGSPKRVVYAFPDLPVKTTATEVTAARPAGEELRPIREMLHVSYPGRINPLLDWLKQQNYLPLDTLDESAVIDAGSSYGYSTVDIGNALLALNPRLHVYGVDPAQGLERIRQKLSIPANVTFIQDDHRLQNGQRPSNIKLIISTNMLVYYDEPTKRKVIQQMGEYLEEGGLMLLGIGGHAERNNSLNFIVLRKQQGQMLPVELVFNQSLYSPDNDEEVFGYWRRYFPEEIGRVFKIRAVDLDQLLKEERNRIRQQLYKSGQTAWERQLPEIFKAQQSLLRAEGINVAVLPDGSVSIPIEEILLASGAGVDKALLADRYWALRQRDESLYKTQLERIQGVSTGLLVEGRDLFEALAYFAQLGETGPASEKGGPDKDLNALINSLKKLSLQIRVEIDYHRNTGYSASHLDFIRTWQALNDFMDVYENNETLRTNLDRLYRQYVNNEGVLAADQAMTGTETQSELWENLPVPVQSARLTQAVRAEIRADGKLYFNGLLSPDAAAATPVHDGSSHMAIARVQGSYSYVLEWLAVRAMLKSGEYDPSSTKLIRVVEERVTELMEDYIQIYDTEGLEAAEEFFESTQGGNIIAEFNWQRSQFTQAVRISREARNKLRNDGSGTQEPIILEFELRPETLLRQDQAMIASKRRILVVDDYESIRKATGTLLRSEDYEVLTAINGEDALRVIEEELQAGRKVDLVLTDLSMPQMNGEQLITQLRQDARFSSIPVIMNTSADENVIRRLAEKLQVPVLTKPFDMDTLINLINAQLPDQAMAARVPSKESVIEVFAAIEQIFLKAVSGEFNEARIEAAKKSMDELAKIYSNPFLVNLIHDQTNYLGSNVLTGLIPLEQLQGSIQAGIKRNRQIVAGLGQMATSRELIKYTSTHSIFDFSGLVRPGDAADGAMLSYIQDDKTKQLLRWMQRASFRIYHAGPMDAKDLMAAAEAVNPGFRHPFKESQLTQFTGEQFERMIRLVNEQIMIPRGFIIHGFKSDGSISYLTLEPGSWKEEQYLGRLSIWTASVKAAEEHISDAFSLGWFAFLDHQTREKFYRELYQRLRRGVQTHDPDGVTALYGKLFKNLKLSEQDFVRIMLSNVLLEEKIHARDAAYTAGLKGDYRTLWVDAPEILIAQTITRPEFELLQRGEGDPDRLNWLAVMEFSAKLQGVILEMEDYLQKGREDLAYFLFFDYIRNQMDYLTSHNEHNHNVALYFIDELLERHLVRDDRLLGYLNRDPEVPPVRQALALLQEIYNKHFYSEEERLQKLTEKNRREVRLPGPLADQSMFGENEIPMILDNQGMDSARSGVDNAMLDELINKLSDGEMWITAAGINLLGLGVIGIYQIWRRYTLSGNIFYFKRTKDETAFKYITNSKRKAAKNFMIRELKEHVNNLTIINSLLEMGVSVDEIGRVIIEGEHHPNYIDRDTARFLIKWGSKDLIPIFQKKIIYESASGAENPEIIIFLKAHNAWETVQVEYEHLLSEYRYKQDVIQLIMQKFHEQERELKDINLPNSVYGARGSPRGGRWLIEEAMIITAKEHINKYGDFRVVYHPADYGGFETIDVSASHNNWATTYAEIPIMVTDASIEILPPSDNAQLSEEVGGIDLNPNNFEIETRGENPPVQIEFDAQKLQDLNIQGFVPVIINITPITNIPLLLGIADEGPSGQKQATTTDESAPLDRRERFSLRETGELSRL